MGFSGLRLAFDQPDSSGQGHLILVVDDDEDNLLFTVYALESLGYLAAAVSTGEACLEQAVAQPPALILLDIVLPGISGLMVLKQLRTHPKTKSVPVVAVTALARPADRQMIMAAGFNGYLAKPYMIEELSQMIQRFF